MRRFIGLMCCATLMFGFVTLARATPVSFDLAGAPDSSVTVQDSARFAALSAQLNPNLGSLTFSLGDGQMQAVDFFTFDASGFWGGNYTVLATLAFDEPDINSAASGSGQFFTIFGVLSGGTLQWDPSTIPATFNVEGNTIQVDFQDGWTITVGHTATVQAYITNLGGATAPVPEPSTMLLMGSGLIGLVVAGRRRIAR